MPVKFDFLYNPPTLAYTRIHFVHAIVCTGRFYRTFFPTTPLGIIARATANGIRGIPSPTAVSARKTSRRCWIVDRIESFISPSPTSFIYPPHSLSFQDRITRLIYGHTTIYRHLFSVYIAHTSNVIFYFKVFPFLIVYFYYSFYSFAVLADMLWWHMLSNGSR